MSTKMNQELITKNFVVDSRKSSHRIDLIVVRTEESIPIALELKSAYEFEKNSHHSLQNWTVA